MKAKWAKYASIAAFLGVLGSLALMFWDLVDGNSLAWLAACDAVGFALIVKWMAIVYEKENARE